MKKSIKFAQDVEKKIENVDDENDYDDEESTASRWKSFNSCLPRPSIIQLENNNNSNIRELITVELRLIILKIGNISTKENKFSCEAFMEATWLDKSLNKNISKLRYDPKIHWNPHLYIQNIISHQSQEIWYNLERVLNGHKVSEKRRFKGEFSQTFDLKNYPLDLQELCISISTFRTPQEIDLVISQEKLSSINLGTFTQTHEWTLHESVCTSQLVKTSDFSSDNHCTIDMSVCISRKPYYYYWNSFLLIFIITMICLCCFSFKCDISSNRMIVGITVLLTLITFKWSLTKQLPSLSYLTILDQYSLMNVMIVFLNCIYYSIMGVLTPELCPDPYKSIDLYAFIISIILFHFLNSLYILRFFLIKFKNRKFLELREKEYNKNTLAKRARIKSIFQSNSINFD